MWRNSKSAWESMAHALHPDMAPCCHAIRRMASASVCFVALLGLGRVRQHIIGPALWLRIL